MEGVPRRGEGVGGGREERDEEREEEGKEASVGDARGSVEEEEEAKRASEIFILRGSDVVLR